MLLLDNFQVQIILCKVFIRCPLSSLQLFSLVVVVGVNNLLKILGQFPECWPFRWYGSPTLTHNVINNQSLWRRRLYIGPRGMQTMTIFQIIENPLWKPNLLGVSATNLCVQIQKKMSLIKLITSISFKVHKGKNVFFNLRKCIFFRTKNGKFWKLSIHCF